MALISVCDKCLGYQEGKWLSHECWKPWSGQKFIDCNFAYWYADQTSKRDQTNELKTLVSNSKEQNDFFWNENIMMLSWNFKLGLFLKSSKIVTLVTMLWLWFFNFYIFKWCDLGVLCAHITWLLILSFFPIFVIWFIDFFSWKPTNKMYLLWQLIFPCGIVRTCEKSP